MQKRSRVSGSDSSAAKRARLQQPRQRLKFELPLSGTASGLTTARWNDLIYSSHGFIHLPPQINPLLTEDDSSESKRFLEFASSRLTKEMSDEDPGIAVAREWYCCKVFIYQSLEQLRSDLEELNLLTSAPRLDSQALLNSAIKVEENLWSHSAQYIYGFPIGRVLEEYCREHTNVRLMQPFLGIFLTKRLTEFLWPLLERMFQWDYINTNVAGFSADESADTSSNDQRMMLSAEESSDQINSQELLWNNIHIPPDLAKHALKQTILNKAEIIRKNQINILEIKAKQPPICKADQPILFVENPAVISILGDNVAVCSGTDRFNSNIGMHRALVKAVSREDVKRFDVAHPWARASTLAIDLTELCLDPQAIRSSSFVKGQPIAGGFHGFVDTESVEGAQADDPQADIICRVAILASTIYRVYMLLKKVNNGPLIQQRDALI